MSTTGYYDEIAKVLSRHEQDSTASTSTPDKAPDVAPDKADTGDADYPKRRPVYVDSWLVTVIEKRQAEGLWGTREQRELVVPGFPPIVIDAEIWGATIEDAIDAVYKEIEIQAPEFMVMHLGRAAVKVKFPVVYTYFDHDDKRREIPVCHLHRDSVTDHWATEGVTELEVEAARDSVDRARTIFVPRRLWGRDKELASARVLAYVDGCMGIQECQSPKLAAKVRGMYERMLKGDFDGKLAEEPTVSKALTRLERAVEYGENAMRSSDYQDMVTLSTALSSIRHTLRMRDTP